jgi:Polysaccharide lyase
MPLIHRLACIAFLALAPAAASAEVGASPAEPVFVEDFAVDPTAPAGRLERWVISPRLAPELRPLRVGIVTDPIGKAVGRVTVEEGDALEGASAAGRAAKDYVCDDAGSRAVEMTARPGGIAPTERAEMQVKTNRASGEGELVKFGEWVWYRFAFKIGADWPRDVPAGGRTPCRTVIHQVKQDSFIDGASCHASPFFKIEARPLGERVQFFAQVATGKACATPPAVRRTRICIVDAAIRERWATVHVRLFPTQDASGRADVWLDGVHCGSYRGPMGDAVDGARHNDVPFINAQPRFGIYRDWRAATQTIYFDRIMVWNSNPAGHAEWRLDAPPE